MTFSRVLDEVNQAPRVRRNVYVQLEGELEKKLGSSVRVIAFFTSFVWPAMLVDKDADMLEELLHNSEMYGRKLVLMINSPGGDALAAERVVNVCRSFVGSGFSVIVPKMAKSAATMICLGSTSIGMSETSELGPIDPQFVLQKDDKSDYQYLAAHEIIESYQELLDKANKSKGRLEPFLQQLQRFDARDIRRIKSHQQLSESIAIRCLHRGMLSRFSIPDIKVKIKPFLDPKYTLVHGRPIYRDVVKKCGLTVEEFDIKSEIWQRVWELYIRLDHVVSSPSSAKIIESFKDSYFASAPSSLRD
jgi:ATP-dependent protease ClpP protease subunit